MFISKASGVYKRDYAFRMNVVEEILIFKIRSCIEILTNDIKVNTIYALQLTKNYKVYILGIFIF